MNYGLTTYLQLEPSSFACRFIAGAAICADGKVRSLRFQSGIADTFFSIPCSVQVKGKTVSGFAVIETVAGYSDTLAEENDPACVKFIADRNGRNASLLPRGAWRQAKDERSALLQMIARGMQAGADFQKGAQR